MSTVLVTGATGFLGRYVVRELTASGRTVVTTSRHPEPPPNSIRWDLSEESPGKLPGAFDEVYHVAGLAHVVPGNARERERFFDINRDGTRRLLQALPTPPRAFVLISTVAVYGRETGINLDETTAREATDAYGASKREAEDLVNDWCGKHDVTCGIVRLPLVTGLDPPGNLSVMLQAMSAGRYLGIGDGSARRSMVWAGDVAAILPVVARDGGTYHLTDGIHPSFAEIETALACLADRKLPRRLPLPVARVAGQLFDVSAMVLKRRLPFSSRALAKMTSTLTFSDAKARAALDWNPSPALEHFTEEVALCR
jgi:nucleoside-diphosphate-sugar epimerase